MKKLSQLLMIAVVVSCADEDMYVSPNGDDLQVAGVISEKSSSSDEAYLVVDEHPAFPGGTKAYRNYLLKTLKYPKEAKEMGIEGNVYLSFVVDTDGTLGDFEVVRSLGGGLNEEALRVYMEGPNWTPGILNGEAVKTRMMARVVFRMHANTAVSISTDGPKKVEEMVFLDVENK